MNYFSEHKHQNWIQKCNNFLRDKDATAKMTANATAKTNFIKIIIKMRVSSGEKQKWKSIKNVQNNILWHDMKNLLSWHAVVACGRNVNIVAVASNYKLLLLTLLLLLLLLLLQVWIMCSVQKIMMMASMIMITKPMIITNAM